MQGLFALTRPLPVRQGLWAVQALLTALLGKAGAGAFLRRLFEQRYQALERSGELAGSADGQAPPQLCLPGETEAGLGTFVEKAKRLLTAVGSETRNTWLGNWVEAVSAGGGNAGSVLGWLAGCFP